MSLRVPGLKGGQGGLGGIKSKQGISRGGERKRLMEPLLVRRGPKHIAQKCATEFWICGIPYSRTWELSDANCLDTHLGKKYRFMIKNKLCFL